ncbi:hypothetical protein Indivirus_2_110 [Indivirus ILV1]|uniref:Uncharacterized protein n=1 Tax=Indivirus ILV1 TaxID=1977633 RepID=A0A1V0SDG2_9VIRU|nr:hypothetical protein Indivirus_2_110 [Indivirus ILV1]
MGSIWSRFYLLFDGKKKSDNENAYYIVPKLVGENVNGAFKIIQYWFPNYKIISIPNIGYIDIALDRKQTVVIHYNAGSNLVTEVEIFI